MTLSINTKEIESRIFTIRGVQVIIDKDLAQFYNVKPIRLREQVKRNANRFPDDFMFQLSEIEVEAMVSQNAIPSKQSLGGYMPLVFTEQGVAAVSAVIKNEKAAEVSIRIMRAFVNMRRFIQQNASLFHRVESIALNQIRADEKIDQLFKALEKQKAIPDKGIFFDGQVFDAYVFIAQIIKQAQNSIILIDNYVDESVLSLFSKRNKKVSATIYTKKIDRQLNLDLKKHNEQYPKIEIKILASSHDRFLIIDNNELYHIGASLKDLGKKWFAFSKMDSLCAEVLVKLGE